MGKYFFPLFPFFHFFFNPFSPFLDINLHVSWTIAIEETKRSRKDGNHTRIVAVKSDLKTENHTRIVAINSDLKAEVAAGPMSLSKGKAGKSVANASHRTLTSPARSDRALMISSEPCC